jgi:hypothetical protein
VEPAVRVRDRHPVAGARRVPHPVQRQPQGCEVHLSATARGRLDRVPLQDVAHHVQLPHVPVGERRDVDAPARHVLDQALLCHQPQRLPQR